MEIDSFLENTLGFEVRTGRPVSKVVSFLPSGYGDEYVLGKWHIHLLDRVTQDGLQKLGVKIEINSLDHHHVVVYWGYVKYDVSEFKKLLHSCTDIFDHAEDDVLCERVVLNYSDQLFHNSAFISEYNIWHFDDLLSSYVPDGFNVLVPDDIAEETSIDLINEFLFDMDGPSVSSNSFDMIPRFPESFTEHFNEVGVNVLDVNSEGKLFISKNFVKEKTLRLKTMNQVFIVRLALKALRDNRVPQAVKFLKEVGLVKDIVILKDIHNQIRISFLNDTWDDVEVFGDFDEILLHVNKTYGNL